MSETSLSCIYIMSRRVACPSFQSRLLKSPPIVPSLPTRSPKQTFKTAQTTAAAREREREREFVRISVSLFS